MDGIGQYITLPLIDPVLIFSVVLVIVLLTPFVFKRLRIPNLVGLILAGVLVGPYGLNLLAYDASFKLLGQVGILYIMFQAGLNMDMNDFRHHRRKGLVFGWFTFLIPFLLGALSSLLLVYLIYIHTIGGQSVLWLYGDADTSVSLLKYCWFSALIIATMYSSNTLLAYPIVSRFGLTRQRSVNITVGGTMISTLLSLLVLAVMLEVVKGDVNPVFWGMFLLKLLVFAVVILLVLPRLTRAFFKRYGDSVGQYIFLMSMLLLSSFFAKLCGLEYILGAFMAGLALNRLVPKRSALMKQVEFVGEAIFIPFFLLSVGMMVNFHVLFHGYLTLLCVLLMSVVATLSKYLAAVATRCTFRMTRDEGLMMFGLSNAHAAAALAVTVLAYDIVIGYTSNGTALRLLPEEVLNGTILLILISSTISSVYTERAARGLVMAEETLKKSEDEKTTTYNPENRILVSVSNPGTLANLMALAMLMRDDKEQQPLYALAISDDDDIDSVQMLRGRKLLERAVSIGASAEQKVKMISRYDLNMANGIANVVSEKNISDLVMGLYGKTSIYGPFFNHQAESLVSNVNRTIYMLHATQPLATVKRMVLVVPAQAEAEDGFEKWVDRMLTLNLQLGARLLICTTDETFMAFSRVLHSRSRRPISEYRPFNQWSDLTPLQENWEQDDLLVLVLARRQSYSFQPAFEKLPKLLADEFELRNFMILFPEQFKEGEIDQVAESKTRIL